MTLCHRDQSFSEKIFYTFPELCTGLRVSLYNQELPLPESYSVAPQH
jgi:hypothetical protein